MPTSYIDYVFVSSHIADDVTSCRIVELEDNVSDHHHACVDLCVHEMNYEDLNSANYDEPRYCRFDLSNTNNCQMYRAHINELAQNIDTRDVSNIVNVSGAEQAIYQYPM